jgi:hypothetical protein
MFATSSHFEIPSSFGDGDPRVCIAVLDGPVDLSHPCFQGANIHVIETANVETCNNFSWAIEHGTHVASILFGQPGSEVVGVASRCKGLIIPVFKGGTPDSQLGTSQLDLARAIYVAIENGATILNVSGGQIDDTGDPDPILARALASCAELNILIVAAAGNDGCDCVHIPAACPTVLAVGAMDMKGDPLPFSNWGERYHSQGVFAVGVDVIGAAPGGGTIRRSGTSFATPKISGFAALLAALQVKKCGIADMQGIRRSLLKDRGDCDSLKSDAGRKILARKLDFTKLLSEFTDGLNCMEISPSCQSEKNSPPPREISAESSATSILASSGFNFEKTNTNGDPRALALSSCGCENREKLGQCMCEKCTTHSRLVFAIGQLGYDFGSDARRDSIRQAMQGGAEDELSSSSFLNFIENAPYEASSVIWTLNLDATPIYAIQPAGAFAADVYERLREFLRGQLHEGVELISLPGVIAGSAKLQSGQIVPVIVPTIRGMYSWATAPLVEAVLGGRPEGDSEAQALYDRQLTGLTDYVNRVYYDLRNLGITATDRALNFSATNAFQIADVIRSSTKEGLELDTITTQKSPICRPDSDCYDVEISFFNPNNTQVANRIFRFTVDVSDVVPVTIGQVRSWTRRVR